MRRILMKLLAVFVGIFCCLILLTGKPSLILPILGCLGGMAVILLRDLMDCIKGIWNDRKKSC